MTANRLVFGITGGSGSGKSYVSEIFRANGVNVLDCDVIAHEVTMPGGAAYDELLAHFGAEYFAADGTLLRKKLAGLVFSDEKELGILNEITHKHIKQEIMRRIEAQDGAAAIDGAVIIGSSVETLCAFLVGVIAPYDMRLERIIKRDGISEEQARQRLDVQQCEDFYRAHCRYIIENDNSCDVTAAVRNILREVNLEEH